VIDLRRPTLRDVVEVLESIAPPSLAMEEHRNRLGLVVGPLYGLEEVSVERIGFSLNPTIRAIKAAVESGGATPGGTP